GDAELQRAPAVVRSNDRTVAEHERRRRSREAREEEAGGQRLIHQTDERLDRHNEVRCEPVRPDLAVADRRECLDAEIESAAESSAEHLRTWAEQRLGAGGSKGACERRAWAPKR